jgi:phosphatidylglycerol lysyltransferase
MEHDTPSSLDKRSRLAAAASTWLPPIAILLVLALSAFVLHRELKNFRYHDITRQALAIPMASLASAGLLTVLSYLVLPSYDTLGLTYAGKRLPLPKVVFASVIAYGLSHTLGFPLVTGGSVHYRFWSSWGLSAEEIAQAASFSGATFIVGCLFVSGVALLLEPVTFLPSWLFRPLGFACLALVCAYVFLSTTRRAPLRVRDWQFPVPSLRLALAQLVVSAVDWTVSGAVLYALLPSGHGIGFWQLIGAYMLAHAAGLISHVSAGLGVFEWVMLMFLGTKLPTDVVAGTLLVYRVIYYLIPFAVAISLIAASEIHRQRTRVAAFATGVASVAGRWVPAMLPTVLSASTLVGGGMLLLSGATPAVRGRMAILDSILPLGVIELSHFLSSLAGAGLIVLAWAIHRRLDAAYGLTIGVLYIGIITSLLKGLDWEEAVALAVVMGVVVPSRRAFYRKAAFLSEPFEPKWIITIVAVVGAATWLGFFSYKHVEYADQLWWQFRPHADAPRFMRATVGVVGALFVFGVMRLLRQAKPEPAAPEPDDLERAAAILLASGNSAANLALLGDKALLFSDNGKAFLMYGIEGSSWIAMGDPVGPKAERQELAWRFRELADQHGARAVFYEITDDNLPLYIDLGFALLKIGEEAIVRLPAFSLEGGHRKGLRRAHRTVQNEGATVEVVPPGAVPELLPELREISDAWLAGKKTREKSFSLGRFDDDYLRRFPVALVRVGGRIVAFANIWTGGKEELSVDLMRFRPEAPSGVMEYLLIELMLWGRQEGYERFNLGMAPLSGLANRQLAPLWNRIGAILFRHGENFYNFQGLRAYKDKFDPVWEPRYLASAGGLAIARVLTNVATLISGGVKGVVAR